MANGPGDHHRASRLGSLCQKMSASPPRSNWLSVNGHVSAASDGAEAKEKPHSRSPAQPPPGQSPLRIPESPPYWRAKMAGARQLDRLSPLPPRQSAWRRASLPVPRVPGRSVSSTPINIRPSDITCPHPRWFLCWVHIPQAPSQRGFPSGLPEDVYEIVS